VPGARDAILAIPGVGTVTTDGEAHATTGANGAGTGPKNGDANAAADRFGVEFAPGRESAARLLEEMVKRGLPVASFAPEPMDLEQAYLRAGIRQVE
jgi:hypothetical protein